MSEETKTIVIESCGACGADVRPDSLFCYNCGESLGLKEATLEHVSAEQVTEAPKASNGVASLPGIKKGPGLRSAATIREQGRSFQRTPIKVKWEPGEPPSDILLIFATICIFLFASLVVGVALYFK